MIYIRNNLATSTTDGLMLELHQPDRSIEGTIVAPGKKFVFNATQTGEHKLCIGLTDPVYDALKDQNLLQIKVEFRYQNEYRKGKPYLSFSYF